MVAIMEFLSVNALDEPLGQFIQFPVACWGWLEKGSFQYFIHYFLVTLCSCFLLHLFLWNWTWGDFSLFCLDSMWSTISAKSSQLCGDKVSLNDRPWMSSYIMQCVNWLWTVFWPSSDPVSSDYFPGELKWRWARYSILQVWSARNSNNSLWFRTNC
jgi:hypothetical protein